MYPKEMFTLSQTAQWQPYPLVNDDAAPTACLLASLTKYSPVPNDHVNALYRRHQPSIELVYSQLEKFKRNITLESSIKHKLKSNHNFTKAVAHVQTYMKRYTCSSLTTSSIKNMTLPINETSSAGIPYRCKKKEAYPTASETALRMLKCYGESKNKRHSKRWSFTPDIVATRSIVAAPNKPKTRLVWVRSFHNLLIEMMCVYPLYQLITADLDSQIVTGVDILTTLPPMIASICNDNESLFYCLDFSSFDATIPTEVKRAAMQILGATIQQREPTAWRFVSELTNRCKLYCPDGRVFEVTTGIASGTFLTSVLGSVCNLLLLTFMQFELFNSVHETLVLGDDSIFSSTTHITLESISTFFRNYGIEVNTNKSIITNVYTDILFLGHNFHSLSTTRENIGILSRLIQPERPIPTNELDILRVSSYVMETSFRNMWLIQILIDMILHNGKKISRSTHPHILRYLTTRDDILDKLFIIDDPI